MLDSAAEHRYDAGATDAGAAGEWHIDSVGAKGGEQRGFSGYVNSLAAPSEQDVA